jgi:hypothetical protein
MQRASTHPNAAFAKIQPQTAQFTFFHTSLQQINLERSYKHKLRREDQLFGKKQLML